MIQILFSQWLLNLKFSKNISLQYCNPDPAACPVKGRTTNLTRRYAAINLQTKEFYHITNEATRISVDNDFPSNYKIIGWLFR